MKKLLFLLLILNTIYLYGQDRITGELFATRSEVIAQNGMVATSHPLASQIGIDILKKVGMQLMLLLQQMLLRINGTNWQWYWW